MQAPLDQAFLHLKSVIPPQVVVEKEHNGYEQLTVLYRGQHGATSPVVRLAFQELPTEWTSTPDSPPDVVWVARDLSPEVRRRFRELGRSFISIRQGEVVIVHPALVIDRIAPKAVTVRTASTIDPFGPGPGRVVLALLNNALTPEPRAWGIRELAAYSGVDRTTTSDVVNTLAAYGLVTRENDPRKRGRGVTVRVQRVTALLDRWSATYDILRNPSITVHAPIGDPRAFLRRLPTILRDRSWALTLQAGASLIAPHASWERIHVYVDVQSHHELADIAIQQGWTTGESGKLTIMRPWYHFDFLRRIRTIDRLPVVDQAQLLIDLWSYPVRGREQAEHLLHQRNQMAPDAQTLPA